MKTLSKLSFGELLLLILLAITPFQQIWLQALLDHGWVGHPLLLLSNWYEPVIIILLIWAVVLRKHSRFTLKSFDWVAIFLLLLAVLSNIWSNLSFSNHLIGLRYSVFPITAYFAGRLYLKPSSTLDQVLKTVFYLLITVTLIQLVSWQFGGFYPLQVRDLAGGWPRIYGSLIGPNQLATYLVLITIWLFLKKQISSMAVGLSFILVVLTFSRSAILALIVSLFVGLFLIGKNRFYLIKALVIFVALVSLLISTQPKVKDAFISNRHSQERIEALSNTADALANGGTRSLLIGHGAGTAGPATFVTGKIFIPENWFLQMIFEFGLVGFGLLLTFWLGLSAALYLNQNYSGLMLVIAISINSLFLHPLADNPAAALFFYLMLGLSISQPQMEQLS